MSHNSNLIEILSLLLFAVSFVNTLMVSKLERLSSPFKIFSDVELVFGFWSIILLFLSVVVEGPHFPIRYLSSLNFQDVLFVFVIMNIATTKPVIEGAQLLISKIVTLIPLSFEFSFFITILAFAPLFGSLITEPAAMAVCAVILRKSIFDKAISQNFKYALLSLLFVNISVGGTLTHFAAPPILIVARHWSISTPMLFSKLGYKSIIAIFLSTFCYLVLFRNELKHISIDKKILIVRSTPIWTMVAHILLLFLSVFFAHSTISLIIIFLIFIAFFKISARHHQSHLEIKEALKVSFFLWGLIVIGGMQAWWLKKIIMNATDNKLFFGATFLTAITDNAALTYLGSVTGIEGELRWALLSGAVAGGGLTVIANAPNPIGLSYLKDSFSQNGISPIQILKWAALPTIITIICFIFLPNL